MLVTPNSKGSPLQPIDTNGSSHSVGSLPSPPKLGGSNIPVPPPRPSTSDGHDHHQITYTPTSTQEVLENTPPGYQQVGHRDCNSDQMYNRIHRDVKNPTRVDLLQRISSSTKQTTATSGVSNNETCSSNLANLPSTKTDSTHSTNVSSKPKFAGHSRSHSQPEISKLLRELRSSNSEQQSKASYSEGRRLHPYSSDQTAQGGANHLNLKGNLDSLRAFGETLRTRAMTVQKASVKTATIATQTSPIQHPLVVQRRRSHELRRSRGNLRAVSLGGAFARGTNVTEKMSTPLLGAKKLLLDALTDKEQQLERLSIGSSLVRCFSDETQINGSRNKGETMSLRIKPNLRVSTGSHSPSQQRYRSDSLPIEFPHGIYQEQTNTPSSSNESESDLKADISNFENTLAWIESQLEAKEGHARALSRSTTDWADMMMQNIQMNRLHRQLRLVQQGAVVFKHGHSRRGCGVRFCAIDSTGMRLEWTKSLDGAQRMFTDPSRSLVEPVFDEGNSNTVSATQSKGKDSKWNSQKKSSFSFALRRRPVVKSIKISQVSNLVYGPQAFELAQAIGVFKGKSGNQIPKSPKGYSSFSESSGKNTSQVVSRIIAIQTEREIGNVQTLVLEFADEFQAEEFFLGLQATVIRAQTRLGSTKLVANRSSQAFLTSAHVDYQRASFHANALRQQNGTANKPSPSSPMNGLSIEKLAGQFRRALNSVESKQQYISALLSLDANGLGVGSGSSMLSQPLVLPLKANRPASGSQFGSMEQTFKDLSRESELYLNAVRYQLGDEQSVHFLLDDLAHFLHNDAFATGNEGNEQPLSLEHATDLAHEILTAATRTVFEGDIFDLCHKLLAVPNKVIICPVSQFAIGPPTPRTPDNTMSDPMMQSPREPTGNQLDPREHYFKPAPVQIFVANDGLITIQSETIFRIVYLPQSGSSSVPEEWGGVKIQSIEHIYCDKAWRKSLARTHSPATMGGTSHQASAALSPSATAIATHRSSAASQYTIPKDERNIRHVRMHWLF